MFHNMADLTVRVGNGAGAADVALLVFGIDIDGRHGLFGPAGLFPGFGGPGGFFRPDGLVAAGLLLLLLGRSGFFGQGQPIAGQRRDDESENGHQGHEHGRGMTAACGRIPLARRERLVRQAREAATRPLPAVGPGAPATTFALLPAPRWKVKSPDSRRCARRALAVVCGHGAGEAAAAVRPTQGAFMLRLVCLLTLLAGFALAGCAQGPGASNLTVRTTGDARIYGGLYLQSVFHRRTLIFHHVRHP